MSECFHCALPSSPEFRALINGQSRDFCCLGCQAVAIAITEGGLSHFYSYREQPSLKPEELGEYEAYNLPEVQCDFVSSSRADNHSIKRASLTVDGISCAACVWLLEKHIGKLPGVSKVVINSSSHQGSVEFDSSAILLSDIFSAFAQIGFKALPNVGQTAQNQWQIRQKTSLLRLGVAGIGMMQAGMVSVALHAGTIQGITPELQNLLRWASLLMATPVLLYSAFPFFAAAWRSLKTRHLTMDVPVSLALILAFIASAYATVFKTGEVYFDSVAMFTFFLLLGRYLEQRVRYRNFLRTGRLKQLLPLTVNKFETRGFEQGIDAPRDQDPNRLEIGNCIQAPLRSLKLGDRVRVGAGETFPCDGLVISGESSADESLLTGESRPQLKTLNSLVVAGSQNIESALEITATAVAEQTRLAGIEQLIEQAEETKPAQVVIADRVASVFVAAVLVVATAVATYWFFHDASKALWVTLSVLVVTCPCALSLATPTALTSALHATRQKGVLMTSGIALEVISQVTDVVFDKTGTLTEGKLKIAETLLTPQNCSESEVLNIIATLQSVSHHPIAAAFAHLSSDRSVKNAKNHVGKGVEGDVQGEAYRVGKIDFCCPDNLVNHTAGEFYQYPSEGLWIALSRKNAAHYFELIAWVRLDDQIRQSTEACLRQLTASGLRIHLLSGDRRENVESFSSSLPFSTVLAQQAPHEKLEYVKALQAQRGLVMMVGDGINDVPVLTAADVSIAMNQSSDIAKLQADAVLLTDNLELVSDLFESSKRVRKIIRQNVAWAIGYNILALPLAAAGFIPPWLAAIGMSASSLVVVINALRLAR